MRSSPIWPIVDPIITMLNTRKYEPSWPCPRTRARIAFRIRVTIVPIVIARNTVAEPRTRRRRTARPGGRGGQPDGAGLGRRHRPARGAGRGAPAGTMEPPLSHISRGYMRFGRPVTQRRAARAATAGRAGARAAVDRLAALVHELPVDRGRVQREEDRAPVGVVVDGGVGRDDLRRPVVDAAGADDHLGDPVGRIDGPARVLRLVALVVVGVAVQDERRVRRIEVVPERLVGRMPVQARAAEERLVPHRHDAAAARRRVDRVLEELLLGRAGRARGRSCSSRSGR